MPESKKRQRPVVIEPEFKSYNPTKTKFGKVVIVILALGMFIGLIVAAVVGMVRVLG
jgi:hypothetical protein